MLLAWGMRTAWLAELWPAAVSAAADRHTMDTLGVPSALLMERAALAVASEVIAVLAGQRLSLRVLCGGGHNGGDGIAMARILRGWGFPAEVWLATAKANDVVRQQLDWARAYGVPITELASPISLPRGPCVWVDAMLGTGTTGAPRGRIAEVLEALAADANVKIAVDLPSGVDPDTGAVEGAVFSATVTVTFGRSKPGLHVTPGRNHSGRIVVADMGLVGAPASQCTAKLIDPAWVKEILAARIARHKGDRGHVAVVGGSAGTAGAIVLVGASALRAGAGLVTLASRNASVQRELLATRPELMVAAADDPTVAKADALVVGPGLTHEGERRQVRSYWCDDPRPSVWDASILVDIPSPSPGGPRIITPHPGEAAAMLAADDSSWTSARVQRNRVAAASALVRRTGAVVVLKGEGTLVATPAGALAICTTGDETLATAGTGDCLAGIVGALLAGGMDAEVAAQVAVHLHGVAGELAGRRFPGATAMDVAETIQGAMARADWSCRWPTLRRA